MLDIINQNAVGNQCSKSIKEYALADRNRIFQGESLTNDISIRIRNKNMSNLQSNDVNKPDYEQDNNFIGLNNINTNKKFQFKNIYLFDKFQSNNISNFQNNKNSNEEEISSYNIHNLNTWGISRIRLSNLEEKRSEIKSKVSKAKGKIVFDKENFFLGEINEDKAEGFGIYSNNMKKESFKGFWKNDKAEGIGFYKSKEFSLMGYWSGNKQIGFGINYIKKKNYILRVSLIMGKRKDLGYY